MSESQQAQLCVLGLTLGNQSTLVERGFLMQVAESRTHQCLRDEIDTLGSSVASNAPERV